MPVTQHEPGRGRYLVSLSSNLTDSGKLADFVSQASANPDLRLLELIGPAGAAHTAIFDMSHDIAAQLEGHFAAGGDLKIEPDQPLSMFGVP